MRVVATRIFPPTRCQGARRAGPAPGGQQEGSSPSDPRAQIPAWQACLWGIHDFERQMYNREYPFWAEQGTVSASGPPATQLSVLLCRHHSCWLCLPRQCGKQRMSYQEGSICKRYAAGRARRLGLQGVCDVSR